MPSISLTDIPIEGLHLKDGSTLDFLEIQSYAGALAKFSMECLTPLTIGVQGEWGSGKTSLLNMVEDIINNTIIPKRGPGDSRLGRDTCKSIWINTWEHSLLKTPEECLLSIIDEIINEISQLDGSWEAAQRAKNALQLLAKGAMRIGAAFAMGNDAAQELVSMSSGGSNGIKSLRSSLTETITNLVARDTNSIERFIIFIDDLDRLDPKIAVMILELLKNIFNIEKCVFILAIDYQVVVKGLKNKFGEQTEENEWEFRAFFDKIIQLPFMMPMGAYNLDTYIENLLKETSFFTKKNEFTLIMKDNKISDLIKATVGANPRALKRLVNSISLIKIQREIASKNIAESDSSELELRQLLIAFVSIQISFPKLYSLLTMSPVFFEWDINFVNRHVDLIKMEDSSLKIALERAMELNEENFDEEWEQSIFQVLWSNGWHKNKILEISIVLSIIKDKILSTVTEEIKPKLLREAIKLTSVTSILYSDDSIVQEEEDDTKQERIKFWRELIPILDRSDNIFSNKKKSTIFSSSAIRATLYLSDESKLGFMLRETGKFLLQIYCDKTNEELVNFFLWLHQNESSSFVFDNNKPKFQTNSIVYYKSQQMIGNLKQTEFTDQKDVYFSWLGNNLAAIEAILLEKYTKYKNFEQSKGLISEANISNEL